MRVSPNLEEVLDVLRANAEDADRSSEWPAASWKRLRKAGVLRWGIPQEFGGDELTAVEILAGSELLGGACLTTAFILSQREAAVRRLLAYPAPALRERYLPALARGDIFLTVGLSQLTTSRRHRAPSLLAEPLPNGYRLDGEIPWVTGADRADAFVVGANLADGRQLLFVLPAYSPGVTVEPPLPLSALAGSRTSLVRCSRATVPRQDLLAGPEEQVLGKSGGGGLETSCLALGLAGAAIDDLHREALARPDVKAVAERFESLRGLARQQLHLLGSGRPSSDEVLALRVMCTRLALRATQAALTISKGTGFVEPHPAQRRARQALFFLVWSCPRPAAEGILADLMLDA